MKFQEMPYARLEVSDMGSKLEGLLEQFNNAQDLEGCLNAYKAIDDYGKEISTANNLAYIRNSLDTTDAYYDAEKSYWDEAWPQIQPQIKAISAALLASPYRSQLEEKWGKLMFENESLSLKTFTPEIVADLQEENRLGTEYDKLVASALIEFDGKTLTLAQLGPYYESPDRAVRKAAMEAANNWRMTHKAAWDDIFNDLVKIRTTIGKKLGHENFVQVGYYRMQRNCYDKEMVARFREGVIKYIVPLVSQIKEAQRKRIGVDALKMYDDPFEYPSGNATPKGTPEEIFAHGQKMYQELSPETAEFFDYMLERDLFDVLTRKGKSGGGYCHTLPKYGAPFIFANFNGTSGDIDVLTHEAGHAYAAYLARDIYPSALGDYAAETAEIHSMAMEFLTWPWMEGFFKEDTDKYYYSHLASALVFLPYGCMVDEFQHHIYEKPEMTHTQRNELWLSLEAVYRPHLDKSDIDFMAQGRGWQRQAHIYEMPFYYIDYCLAQIVALSFWAKSQQNREEAWAKYHRLVSLAGTKTFVELLEDAQMPSPFVSDNLKLVSDEAQKFLDGHEMKLG